MEGIPTLYLLSELLSMLFKLRHLTLSLVLSRFGPHELAVDLEMGSVFMPSQALAGRTTTLDSEYTSLSVVHKHQGLLAEREGDLGSGLFHYDEGPPVETNTRSGIFS